MMLYIYCTLIVIDRIHFLYRESQEEMVLADMHLKPGEPWEYCPREALRRVSKVLKEEFNLVSKIFNALHVKLKYLDTHFRNAICAGDECWV